MKRMTSSERKRFSRAATEFNEEFNDPEKPAVKIPYRLREGFQIEQKGSHRSLGIKIDVPNIYCEFDPREYGLPVRQYHGVPIHYIQKAYSTPMSRQPFSANGRVMTEGDPRGRGVKIIH